MMMGEYVNIKPGDCVLVDQSGSFSSPRYRVAIVEAVADKTAVLKEGAGRPSRRDRRFILAVFSTTQKAHDAIAALDSLNFERNAAKRAAEDAYRAACLALTA